MLGRNILNLFMKPELVQQLEEVAGVEKCVNRSGRKNSLTGMEQEIVNRTGLEQGIMDR